jgi:hypothetical protein
MSFLFHKKSKTVVKWAWGIVAVIIILSMLFAYGIGGAL